MLVLELESENGLSGLSVSLFGCGNSIVSCKASALVIKGRRVNILSGLPIYSRLTDPVNIKLDKERPPRLSHKNFTCLNIDSRAETESAKFSMAA